MDLIANPSLVKKEHLEKLHYIYRGPMRCGLIAMDKGMLVFKEPILGDATYRVLRIVPRDLCTIVFITFHANPIGGHRSLNATIVRIRMRFFWPERYTYC